LVPSDHYITDEEAFVKEIEFGLEKASKENILVTLGIKPNKPETGYGYIQYSSENDADKLKKVKTFAEKPSLELAIQFLKSGDFLWNSGIFIWSASSILAAFEQYQEEMSSLFVKENQYWNTDKEKEAVLRIYNVCKSISVDYGILEKANNVYVIPVDMGWSDLGTWGSLYEASPKNEQNNAFFDSNIIVSDTQNCIVRTGKEKLFVIQGLDGYIVAENEGLVLICPLEKEQEIKALVNQIRLEKGEKFL
jgi:mannose-1-phosphate guanylyltransferase